MNVIIDRWHFILWSANIINHSHFDIFVFKIKFSGSSTLCEAPPSPPVNNSSRLVTLVPYPWLTCCQHALNCLHSDYVLYLFFFLFVCVLCHVASFFFNRLRWMSGKKHGSRHNFSYIELIERASKLFSPSQCMLWGRIQPSLIHNGEKKNSTQKIMRGCTLCEGT